MKFLYKVFFWLRRFISVTISTVSENTPTRRLSFEIPSSAYFNTFGDHFIPSTPYHP